MARFVFFSFHYERDIWRVNQVRNAWVTQGNHAAGYVDSAAFEQVKRRGQRAVYDWIDEQLAGTTVTAILIGWQTAEREYVHYEIAQSIERGNGFVPIYIYDMKDQQGKTDWLMGRNPLEDYETEDSSLFFPDTFADLYPSYEWLGDDGYSNFGDWVENAYELASD